MAKKYLDLEGLKHLSLKFKEYVNTKLEQLDFKPNDFIVKMSYSMGNEGATYSVDKTNAEIYQAYQEGKTVRLYNVLTSVYYDLEGICTETNAVFAYSSISSMSSTDIRINNDELTVYPKKYYVPGEFNYGCIKADPVDETYTVPVKFNSEDGKTYVPAYPEGIPVGGTTGQVLTKKSDTDNDVEWTTVTGGSGGSENALNKDAKITNEEITQVINNEIQTPIEISKYLDLNGLKNYHDSLVIFIEDKISEIINGGSSDNEDGENNMKKIVIDITQSIKDATGGGVGTPSSAIAQIIFKQNTLFENQITNIVLDLKQGNTHTTHNISEYMAVYNQTLESYGVVSYLLVGFPEDVLSTLDDIKDGRAEGTVKMTFYVNDIKEETTSEFILINAVSFS